MDDISPAVATIILYVYGISINGIRLVEHRVLILHFYHQLMVIKRKRIFQRNLYGILKIIKQLLKSVENVDILLKMLLFRALPGVHGKVRKYWQPVVVTRMGIYVSGIIVMAHVNKQSKPIHKYRNNRRTKNTINVLLFSDLFHTLVNRL